jgi:hypothetical protein
LDRENSNEDRFWPICEVRLASRVPVFAPVGCGRISLPRRLIYGSKREGHRILVAFAFGGDEEDRTLDLRIANATLSQLSYIPMLQILSTTRCCCNVFSAVCKKMKVLYSRDFSDFFG